MLESARRAEYDGASSTRSAPPASPAPADSIPNGRCPRCRQSLPLARSRLLVGLVMLRDDVPVRVARPAKPRAARRPGPVFTASDFPALAEGIDLKTSGELSVHAWAPANAGWKLTQDGETVTLTSSPAPGDSSPRWHKLGKVTTRSGHPLKITVPAKEAPRDRRPEGEGLVQGEAQGDTPRRPCAPGPQPRGQGDPDRVLDLVRGRIDSLAPPDDCSTQPRPDQPGGGRLPAARVGPGLARPGPSPPRADARRPRALADVAEDAARIRRSTASSTATATRSRRSSSRPCPGSRSAATSTGRRQDRDACRACSARTATGKTAGSIPRSSSGASAGPSSAAWSSCTTWSATTTASRSPMSS